MKQLILHIGHGKTGTSYIQSVLASNLDNLKRSGIHYPKHHSFSSAVKGEISSGNGLLLLDDDFTLQGDLPTLLSSEILFHDLTVDDRLQRQALGKTENLTVILYTRDVMDLLRSTWGQAVKRGGSVDTFSEFLAKLNDPHHARVHWWIKASKRFGFTLRIRNYSKHKNDIIQAFLNDLPLAEGFQDTITLPPSKIVNRSLSKTEYEFQRVLNKIDRKASRFISDPLVNRLPNVAPGKILTDFDTFEMVETHYKPLIEGINHHLEGPEKIEFGAPADFVGADANQDSLSGEQIDIITQGLERIFSENQTDQAAVNILRDTALKISRNETLTIADALSLMKLAQASRPDGPAINRKVKEWSQLVNKEQP